MTKYIINFNCCHVFSLSLYIDILIRRRNDARIAADWRKYQQNRQERLDLRQKFLRDEEQRIHEFNTKRQFDIMNRYVLGFFFSVSVI